MKDLAKAMEACEKFDELKEEFMSTLCAAMKSRGLESMDTKEVGEAVDIIKDFSEAKKYCMEALYYQKVTEAMLSYEEPRYGYNPNRYSSGRYAPKGMGTRGYIDGNLGYVMNPVYDEDWNSTGYSSSNSRDGSMTSGRSNRGGNNGGNSGQSMGYSDWHMQPNEDYDQRYGKSYNEFCKDRRYYTVTKSDEEKRKMDKHAEEHVQDIVVSVKDIWKDADPNLRKHMKDSLSKLISEMT